MDKMENLKNLNNRKSGKLTDLLDTTIKDAIYSTKWLTKIEEEIEEKFQIGVQFE